MGTAAGDFEVAFFAPDRFGYDIPATAAIIAMNASTDRNLFVLLIVHPWCSIRREPVKSDRRDRT